MRLWTVAVSSWGPADGFYEWKKLPAAPAIDGGKPAKKKDAPAKQPYAFTLASGEPLEGSRWRRAGELYHHHDNNVSAMLFVGAAKVSATHG